MTVAQFIASILYVASYDAKSWWRYSLARKELMQTLRGVG